MKSTWLAVCGGRAGRVRFQGTNKRPAKGEELNDLVTRSVKEILKPNKRVKSNAKKLRLMRIAEKLQL